jgi:biotin operon repressor
MRSKNSTGKKNFYLPILNSLKERTNLTKIKDELNISKQQLNYYLRQLKNKGLIIHKGQGWYEIDKSSKNSTKYGSLLSKDYVRGHAYVWTIKLPQEIVVHYKNRLEVIKEKKIHHKLVGALKTTPRIKVLGRKVWLCNNHLRIFDKPNTSYYGKNAIESRKYAFKELLLIVGALESKLGISLKPFKIDFKKEHYALIKNDLAIDQNRKGIIWRINDEQGEWLLIDDSLEQGGELENVGKLAFDTNIPMQKWWNDKKDHNFKITDTFLLETINKVTQNQMIFDANMSSHLEVLENIGIAITQLKEEVKKLNGKH